MPGPKYKTSYFSGLPNVKKSPIFRQRSNLFWLLDLMARSSESRGRGRRRYALARPGEVRRTLRAGRDLALRSRDDDEHENSFSTSEFRPLESLTAGYPRKPLSPLCSASNPRLKAVWMTHDERVCRAAARQPVRSVIAASVTSIEP